MAKTNYQGPDAGSGLETHDVNEALQIKSLVRQWRIGVCEAENGEWHRRGHHRHF